jgi:hypothetical protein
MASPSIIPCVEIPQARPFQIRLPFGGALQSFANFADGPPTDCALIHSLILQLMPTLGGMTCFLNVLSVIRALKDFASSPDPLGSLGELVTAINKMLGCFNVFTNIPSMIGDILRVIIAYLRCFIHAVESILEFQAGIDLNAARGNPVMLASLSCAQKNASTSLAQLMQALSVIEPLMEALKPIMQLGPIQVTLPSFKDVSAAEDLDTALKNLDKVLLELQQAADLLP